MITRAQLQETLAKLSGVDLDAVGAIVGVTPSPTRLAVHCDHANEVPMTCPCDADCYCRSHTCKERT